MFSIITRVGKLPIPKLTLVIAFVMIGLFYVLGPASEDLLYQHDKIIDGEFWRLITGHFIHCDFQHLIWNLVAFIILGTLIESNNPHLLIATIAAGIVGVNSWLIFDSNIVFYCGLSGVLNSLFVVAIFLIWQDTKNPILPAVALGYAIKLVLEVATSSSFVTEISWQSTPLAHVAGMFAGLTCVIIMNQPYDLFCKRIDKLF